MRVLMYYSNNDVRLEEMPTPQIRPGELLFSSTIEYRTSESRITNSYGKINETILKVNSLFSFVTRHSLIVIRLLLNRQLKLPILKGKLSKHGNSQVVELFIIPQSPNSSIHNLTKTKEHGLSQPCKSDCSP